MQVDKGSDSMRPQEARPVKTDCTFTPEDMAELAKARALADSCRGMRKAEAAAIMQAMTKHQQDLVVRWLVCRIKGGV